MLGAGILDGSEASDKASGIDINVWTGIGMLALGLLMLLWMRLSPTAVVQEDGGPDDRGRHPRLTVPGLGARMPDPWTLVNGFTRRSLG